MQVSFVQSIKLKGANMSAVREQLDIGGGKPSGQRSVPIALLVTASVVLTLCMGMRNSLGLFFVPMAADIGMTASFFGLSLAIQNLTWGLAQPVLGAIADRWGTRPVLIVAALTYAAGLFLMGAAQNPMVGLGLGAGILVGIGVAGTGFGTLMGAVSRATPEPKRSWAVGLVAAAGSLGTIAIAPLGQHVIEAAGWRMALFAFAGIAGAMALASTMIREKAVVSQSSRGGPTLGTALSEAFRHPGFNLMMAAFFACGFQLTFIATHLPGYLAMCGLPAAVGASSLALIGLFNAAGSYGAGWLGGRYNKSHLLALVYLLRTIGVAVFLLVPISTVSALIFAACMGLLWLSVAPLVSGLIGQMFGLRHFNTLFGVVFFSHQLGSFAGAWVGGAVRDATGNYTIAWLLMIIIGLTAFTLQWMMSPRERLHASPG